MQYPAQRGCGRCGLPAVYRLVRVDPDDSTPVMFARRSHYRCADCFYAGLTPPALMTLARNGEYLVVDPTFTAAVSDGLCLCGLPADHRHPAAGEPRGCIDETVRMVRVPKEVPPYVTRDESPRGER
jgi:hypothetical protein